MPNWCENNVRLEVPNKEEKDKIIAVLDSDSDGGKDVGLLNYLMPEPSEEYTDGDDTKDKDKIFPDWYSWRCTNWGTKWDVDIQHWNVADNGDGSYTFNMSFDSAWSPPLGVYDEVYKKHDQGWNMSGTYIEGGMCFMGYYEDGTDNSFDIGTRTTTEAPDWLVDEFSWHYDSQEEYEQEDDVDLVVKGEMTHEAFIEKWGKDTYNDWVDLMTPGTGDPAKKEALNG